MRHFRTKALLFSLLVTGFAQAADYDLKPLPQVISYHGHLEKDGVAVNGNRSMSFKLYLSKSDCQAAGTPVWQTTRTVPVYSGDFAVQLGDSAAGDSPIDLRLFRSAETSLAVSVEGTALLGCQVLTPTPYAQRSAGDVPIGTVIDWWRADDSVEIPAGYKICDGTQVNDPRSPLDGKNVPNLKDKFVRGVTDPANIGQSGGSDDLDLPDYTGSGTTSEYSHRHKWVNYWSSTKKWTSYSETGTTVTIVDWESGIDNSGTGQYPLSRSSSSDNKTYYTNRDTHSHTVTIHSSPDQSGTGKNVPEYVGLLKLIRIY